MLLFWASFIMAQEKTTIRFGHFPNITHAQGVIAHALSRQGKGWFEKSLGPNVEIQWFTYNAGPSAMEAIFAGSLDVTYVGPSPALNAYFKSNGEEIRAISGAANAGAALVVKADSPIKTPADFRGKKIATPQLGNTQDVAARSGGKIRLSPGTLYGCIHRILEQGLVIELDAKGDERRRFYRLTPFGRKVAKAEAARLAQSLEQARIYGLAPKLS